MNTQRIRHVFVAISAACAISLSVNAAPQPKPPVAGEIVFVRAPLDAEGFQRGSSLFVSMGATVRPLTRAKNGVFDSAGSWSPLGTFIAFQRGSNALPPGNRFDIYTIDSHGGHLRRLTAGPGNFTAPAWGPTNRIAYASNYGDRSCLSVVDFNGRHRRDLLCIAVNAEIARPTWIANGTGLIATAGYYVGDVDPRWRSLAYRIDLRTGAVRTLADVVQDEPKRFDIAPDGRHGLFSDPYTSRELSLVDFATGNVTTIGWGYAPRWSNDGRRIAFTGEVYEDAPEFRYYEPLYVMDADGDNLRRVTRARVDNLAYKAVGWSRDGEHVLVNRRIYLDPSLTATSLSMRLIDVDSGVVTPLPGGYAETGAWRER